MIMDSNDEDWFFESISRYKSLNMFQLEYPVQELESINNNSICVSCSNKKRHQLLELSLPQKLLSKTNESDKMMITSDTDLKIKCGTFTENMICQVKTIDPYVVYASQYYTCGVAVYKLSSDDSDEIKKESCSIDYNFECPLMALNGTQLWLTKNSTDPICLFDRNTEKLIMKSRLDETRTSWECNESIQPLYLDSNLVAICCQLTGKVHIFDLRTHIVPSNSAMTQDSWSMVFTYKPEDERDFWTFTSLYECSDSFSNTNQQLCLAKMSKSGTLKAYDTRNFSAPAYINKNIGLKTIDSSLRVRFKPRNKDWISVSGFDGNIYVYKLRASADPERVFTHDGHRHVEGHSPETVTTSHVWSTLDNVIISAAANGTVQLWQYEDSVLLHTT